MAKYTSIYQYLIASNMAFISLKKKKKTKNKENAKIQEKYKLKMGELILYY